MVVVSESLVDAKDEARQEVRGDLSEALWGVEQTIFRQTKWIVGILLGLGSILLGAMTVAVCPSFCPGFRDVLWEAFYLAHERIGVVVPGCKASAVGRHSLRHQRLWPPSIT